MLLLTILYNRMMDSGETAQAAPKGKRRTLRQKNRILDETLESDSTDEAKSFRYKDRAHVCIRVSFKKSARYKQGGGMVSEAETGHMDVFVMKGIRICP